ncbi:MAG: TolC family protein, partial [Verrucomicrobiota bacterium]
ELDALIAKQRNPKVADLTIQEAITNALKKNPDILGAVQELNTTSGRFISVRSRIIPQVTVKSDYGYTSNELQTVQDLGAPNVNDEQWGVNIEFSQLIYDGGAVVSGMRAAISDEVESYYRLRGIIDRTIFEVKSNFYEVVLNRALIIANQQSVDLLAEQLKDQENRYEAGTVPRFNVLQAEVALANAKPPLIQAENNYRVSMFRLVRLLGMDYPPGFPSEVPFNVVGKLDYKPRDFNADDAIRSAVTRNPDLKAQRQLILGEAARVNQEFAGYLPQISARATQTNQSDMLTSSLTNMVNGWFFGVNGSWAVWDGLQTYGNVKTAKARLEQAKINYDNGVREVILQVQQAISNILEAKETVDSQEASVVQGVEALRLA